MHQRSFHYAWIVVAVTFLVLLVGAGIRATPSVLIIPLQQEFGWTNAEISGAIAINILLYGLVGPFAAALMERFGLRKSICSALALLALGTGLSVFIQASWQLKLLWGVVVGLGSGMVAIVLGATVAERWFQSRRGLVVGLLTASSATGQLVFLPLLAWLVSSQGWRLVTMFVAFIALALIPLVILFVRDRPASLGLAPFGGEEVIVTLSSRRNPAARAVGALWNGLGQPDFWLLAGSFFICGASTNGLIGTHLIAACGDHGIPEVRAAGLLALMGVFDFLGTTGSGWLTDRCDSRWLLFSYYGLRGLSLLYLPFAFDGGFFGLPLFAIFYGLDWIATVPPTIRLAEKSFGRENAAVMFGWIAAAHQVGGAFAALAAGSLRTGTGNYFSAFLSAGIMCFLAAFLVLFIGRSGPSPFWGASGDKGKGTAGALQARES
ncbi:MFS transporter [Beijerinckia mobilis]|uniref:MFS transporter n=1 Tax=Beijerinckia mobilis TaxID=231434 RepID=UPI000A015B82|nr:MFS transporter [Beijerinckia mobilis]